MRGVFWLLLASVPLFGEPVSFSVTSSPGDSFGTPPFGATGGATENGVFAAGGFVACTPSLICIPPIPITVTASVTGDFVLTVRGLSGFGYYEPNLSAGTDYGSASASVGSCGVGTSAPFIVEVSSCDPVPFEFEKPQIIPVSAIAEASATEQRGGQVARPTFPAAPSSTRRAIS